MSSTYENDLNAKSNVRALKFRSLDDDAPINIINNNQQDTQRQQQRSKHHHNVIHPSEFPEVPPKSDAAKLPSRLEDDFDNVDDYVHRKSDSTLLNSKPIAGVPAVRFDRVCFEVSASQQNSTSNPIGRILNQVIPSFDCCKSANEQQQQLIQILKSIKLEVPQGSIFGLLGPSSCGKTTLLRCLVGLLKASSGSIELFGRKLTKQGRLPSSGNEADDYDLVGSGPAFGYMPQDLALYEDFTIRQLLTMFGRFTGMNSELIEDRLKFMAKFLDLPEVDREIMSLSGGQKRRVSFAIACIHMPPLIILDEPTVGVDPILRQSIWRYLRELARDQGRTIIITTHYIEEAAQADQVALMRAGEILVQDAPKRIMERHNCTTLEEAFLQICNNVVKGKKLEGQEDSKDHIPEVGERLNDSVISRHKVAKFEMNQDPNEQNERAYCRTKFTGNWSQENHHPKRDQDGQNNKAIKKKKFMLGNGALKGKSNKFIINKDEDLKTIARSVSLPKNHSNKTNFNQFHGGPFEIDSRKFGHKPTTTTTTTNGSYIETGSKLELMNGSTNDLGDNTNRKRRKSFREKLRIKGTLLYALFYKNYRRNMNSIPLIAFQFMLPIIQMISFSLCVGGRPSGVGLGLVNHDSLEQFDALKRLTTSATATATSTNDSYGNEDYVSIGDNQQQDLLSKKYLNFIDKSVLDIREYPNLKLALNDVRRAKLWAAIEFGENFTTTLLTRFDPDNFYTLERDTIAQSVIKLYPDRSNKILDMICMRILVNSFREFLGTQFDHLKQLPIQVKEVIFDIKPNLISNSLDGYTESIAAGLLASLTYIMAAGLTTFIMVVERGKGILERTYTSGVHPVLYLMAHAVFRSLVMMVQIGLVMFLTFYILEQPSVGSLKLAYFMLMTLNVTGISYGLLVSSLVGDQNGAALTIVSSLVVKITLAGILWPLEAIPVWLRTICLAQPLTLPIQALKQITLKGATIEHRSVQLGFLVSIGWTCLFLFIAARRFKFYQH